MDYIIKTSFHIIKFNVFNNSFIKTLFSGLLKTLFMPYFMHLSTYSCSVCPVTPHMMGCSIFLSYKYYLIKVVALHPSITGILISIRIKAKLQKLLFFSTSFLTILTASSPLLAVSHMSSMFKMPAARSTIFAESLLNCSSSTTKIL